MNNIISLTGHKNCGKLTLAYRLAKNSAVEFIRPYTDALYNKVWEDRFNFVSEDKLTELMDSREVLYESIVNSHRYVFFKDQLIKDYNVLIVDDYGVAELHKKYSKYLYSVKVTSKNQSDSERVGVYLYNHEFDEVFDYDTSDVEDLEARIEANLTWK